MRERNEISFTFCHTNDKSKYIVLPIVIHNRKGTGDGMVAFVCDTADPNGKYVFKLLSMCNIKINNDEKLNVLVANIEDLINIYNNAYYHTYKILTSTYTNILKKRRQVQWLYKQILNKAKSWMYDTIEIHYNTIYKDDKFKILCAINTVAKRNRFHKLVEMTEGMAKDAAEWKLKDRCARKIQHAFKEAISNPNHPMCKQRLEREYYKLIQDLDTSI